MRKPKIIAEIAQAHDGSLGQAFAFIDAVADADADAVKFQCHMPDQESTPAEKFRAGCFFPQDRTRQGYWQRTAFTFEQWVQLREHAADCGLEFGVSCFCSRAVRQMAPICDFLKVPAGEYNNPHIIEALSETSLPIYWSLGMSSLRNIPAHIYGRVTPLYCVTSYPARPEKLDLFRVNEDVGLSDHSGTIWAGILAAWRQAPAIEVHVCWDRGQFGPDSPASITIAELPELVSAARWISCLGRTPATPEDQHRAAARYRLGRLQA